MATTTLRTSTGYQSDDEYDRLKAKKQYSREDFKEIYCINEKAVEGLEKSRSTGFLFLGCLSSYQESPCKRRYSRSTSTESSIFTSCYSQPENHEKCVYYYHEPIYHTSSSSRIVDTRNSDFIARPRSVVGVSRESLYNEAKRFTWNEQMERYVERSQLPHHRPVATRYPSAPISNTLESSRSKHVSFTDFTRSATSTSFDEHKIRKARFDLMNGGISQERLIDSGRKTMVQQEQALLWSSRSSLNAGVMRTQATQTDCFIVRAQGPPQYLSLSPRTSSRVNSRMVSQGAQTNGHPEPKKIEPTPGISTSTTPSSLQKPPQKPPPLETSKTEAIEQTEEEFHENLLSLFSPTLSDQTVIEAKTSSSKQTSPTSTSSSGSYSLTNSKLNASFKLSQLDLPTEIEEENLFLVEILKPPEGFGDSDGNSRKQKANGGGGGGGGGKKRKSVRAKSEERERDGLFGKIDAGTQSSISLHASLVDLSSVDDDDCGIYMEPYTTGTWVYIGENEELQVWRKHEPLARTSSGDSTLSEQDFCKKFIALTHRMVHRKASGETYRRLAANCLEINKRITLHRSQNGEYGFRIHGSRPVVVSAVESSSPAEQSGLEVGDVIMSINGIHVLDSSHSDVVRIASQAESLEVELARTKDVLVKMDLIEDVLFEGELFKKNSEDHWVKRFFRLKSDACIYQYKSNVLSTPTRILPLTKPSAVQLVQSRDVVDEKSMLQLRRSSRNLMTLATDEVDEMNGWVSAINTVISQSLQDDNWIFLSGKYVSGPPNQILSPDCQGTVWKLGRRIKTWSRRFAILKDACLYFYNVGGSKDDQNQPQMALGATHLHGYRVQTVSILGGKRHAFELVPPENSMRHYYLATDSEHERKRWLAALEYSIDRWINLSTITSTF